MSIVTFGKKQRLKFMTGGTLDKWQPAQGPAIYALTYKQDAVLKPKSHTVVYFGEAEDLASPTIYRDLRKWWETNSGELGELYVFFHPMPGSSQYERGRVQHQLALEYEPRGNE